MKYKHIDVMVSEINSSNLFILSFIILFGLLIKQNDLNIFGDCVSIYGFWINDISNISFVIERVHSMNQNQKKTKLFILQDKYFFYRVVSGNENKMIYNQ